MWAASWLRHRLVFSLVQRSLRGLYDSLAWLVALSFFSYDALDAESSSCFWGLMLLIRWFFARSFVRFVVGWWGDDDDGRRLV